MAEDLTHTAGPGRAAVVETSAPAASPPGYELIDEIGRGGMGVVYRARDLALARDVAVKLLGEESPATAEALVAEQTRAWTQVSPTPEAGSHTQAGSLVGTPAFIPPEQAIGQIERVTERADVFGLGALLAVILTGQPPY